MRKFIGKPHARREICLLGYSKTPLAGTDDVDFIRHRSRLEVCGEWSIAAFLRQQELRIRSGVRKNEIRLISIVLKQLAKIFVAHAQVEGELSAHLVVVLEVAAVVFVFHRRSEIG